MIGDRPLQQLVPLYRDPRSDMAVTQFDMKYVEAAGLVKFDFLGLKTLSVLQKALDLIEARTGERPPLDTLSWDDEGVYALLQKGDTVGVFQLESEGMRRALAQVRPSNFGDIIAIGALYRPGPMDNIPLFADRKNGRVAIEYPHPLLEIVLGETYGVIVYQEQVMQAAQLLAGYTLGGADELRRAMGKKIQSVMDVQRAVFVEGCAIHNNIDAPKANELFDLIDKFAGYGFNKSHAAAYALLSYQTAWIKVHYPEDFFAASMAFDISNTDKLSIFVDDMRRVGVVMLAPCINRSEADFSVQQAGTAAVRAEPVEAFPSSEFKSEEEGREDFDKLSPNGEKPALAVRYALGALKSVGEGAMATLCVERDANGPFQSIADFADRISPKLVNRRQIEALGAAGAFDTLEPNRAAVYGAAELILSVAAEADNGRTSGQGGLFGGEAHKAAAIKLPANVNWPTAERMTQEREAFGFYFSAHPVDRYRHVATVHGAKSYAAICEIAGPAEGGRYGAMMAGLVEDVRWRTSARGRRYCNATISDASGQFIAACFDDEAGKALEEAAKDNACVLLSVELDRQAGEETPRVAARRVQRLEGLAASNRLKAVISVDDAATLAKISLIIAGERGGRGEIMLHVDLGCGDQAQLLLGRDFALDGELAERIKEVPGVASVELMPIDPPRLALVS